MKRFVDIGFLIAFLLLPIGVLAQVDFSGLNSGLTGAATPDFGQVSPGVGGLFTGTALIAYPNYPEPYEVFEVELSAPGYDSEGAIIRWFVNGEEVLEAKNSRKHSFTALGLGEAMNIKVTLDKQNGTSEQKTLRIVPTQLDIVVEARTTVPAFYQGRAVPSRGTEAYASAVVHTGKGLNRDNLSYRWELNNKVLAGGSIYGLQGISFEMPLDNESYLKVSVSDQNGIIAEKTLPIRPVDSEIIFYEDHPLRGVTGKALNNRMTIAGNQVTLRAEPYYARPFQRSSERYIIGWSLNGQDIDNAASSEINSLTLRASGSKSSASATFRIVDLSHLAHETVGSLLLNFGQ